MTSGYQPTARQRKRAEALMAEVVLPPDGMTPDQALQRWNFLDDPSGWHSQPVCECGDYLAQHSAQPPYRCLLPNQVTRGLCCARFRFARMGGGHA